MSTDLQHISDLKNALEGYVHNFLCKLGPDFIGNLTGINLDITDREEWCYEPYRNTDNETPFRRGVYISPKGTNPHGVDIDLCTGKHHLGNLVITVVANGCDYGNIGTEGIGEAFAHVDKTTTYYVSIDQDECSNSEDLQTLKRLAKELHKVGYY